MLPRALFILALATTAAHAQVESFDLIKGQLFEQSAPTPSRYLVGFGARIFESAPNGLTSATLTSPLSQHNLIHTPFIWGHEVAFNSIADMDAAYPAGTYTFAIAGGSLGAQSQSLTLPATAFPAIPSILNWHAAQAINPAHDFTLNLNPYTVSTTLDSLAFLSVNTFFTPILPGQSSVVIPAGTFSEGEIGTIHIEYLYQHQIHNHAFGGATSRVGFAVSNTSTFATIPAPVSIAAVSLVLFAYGRRRH